MPIIKASVPPWCPRHLRPLMTGRRGFSLLAPERLVLRKRRPISVSAWAERHRRVHESVYPGPWSNDTAQYLTGIMDASDVPHVEEIVICKCPQSGGTEAAYNFVGKRIDRAPGPVMFVFPDERMCSDNAKERIIPMITSSPGLRRYMTGVADDLSARKIRLVNATIHFGWSHSPSSMANKPIRYMVYDEVDKYPATASKEEAGVFHLGDARLNTYRSAGRSKTWKLSTPTTPTGNIWTAYTAAQARYDFWVRCPECDAEQLMEFRRIRWPEKYHRDPEAIRADKAARYHCAHCAAQWDDATRNAAVLRGKWRLKPPAPDGDDEPEPHDNRAEPVITPAPLESSLPMEIWSHIAASRPRSIAFHVPGWISPFIGLSEIAAAFFASLSDKVALRDFCNNFKAEPWREYIRERPAERLLAHRDDRPAGRVPGNGEVAALVAGCDTQTAGFYFSIFAVGWGYEQDAWLVRHGYVDTFEALSRVLWRDEYRDVGGNLHVPMLSVIDAMGDKTAEVYDFCREHRGLIHPLKGEQRMSSPHAYTNLEYYPGGVRMIPGGLRLVRVSTNHYKNMAHNKLYISPGDPGSIRLHSETDIDYCKQILAEYIDDAGLWQCPKYKANHYWDCMTYAFAAADMLGVRHWQRPGAATAQQKRDENPANSRPTAGRRPSWFGGGRR